MAEAVQTVESLKKVVLLVDAGTGPETMDLTPAPMTFEMIVGTDSEGLTPLEYAIHGKGPGESVQLHVTSGDVLSHFHEDAYSLLKVVGDHPRFWINATIKRIEPATDREIVHAMARRTGQGDCGCGGSCG